MKSVHQHFRLHSTHLAGLDDDRASGSDCRRHFDRDRAGARIPWRKYAHHAGLLHHNLRCADSLDQIEIFEDFLEVQENVRREVIGALRTVLRCAVFHDRRLNELIHSFRGGGNRVVLERIKETGDIFWALSDRNWILEGANVHVSLVAFDDGTEQAKSLDESAVSTINSDLSAATDTTGAMGLLENEGIFSIGTQKNGSFELTSEDAKAFLSLPLNPNGRPNSDVIKPWINARDITERPRAMRVIDFGADLSEADACLYEAPFEYLKIHVKPLRAKNHRESYRTYWWIHAEARPTLRKWLNPLYRYIATPRVSKHRIFQWISTEVIPDCAVGVFAVQDDYTLGILHSRIHELWARKQGTQLREVESGFRYTPKSCFETFPFPWPPGKEPKADPKVQAIAAAACELVEKRDAWLNPSGASQQELTKRTLTNLYNQRPAWLDDAHRKLDEAVFAAYGWPSNLSDSEILERLLALNHQRAAKHAPVATA